MPIPYLRKLTAAQRSPEANRHLAYVLTFVAGAVNAGGFLAVQQYTSHMSGIVSMMADAPGGGRFAGGVAAAALLSFLAGAASSAFMINFGRRSRLASEYALPLLLEAVLLLAFGLLGANIEQLRWFYLPATVMLLCYIMGLQNAMITKVSKSEIRTTHVTGMVTDIGIELGKLFYWNAAGQSDERVPVRADRAAAGAVLHGELVLRWRRGRRLCVLPCGLRFDPAAGDRADAAGHGAHRRRYPGFHAAPVRRGGRAQLAVCLAPTRRRQRAGRLSSSACARA